MRPLKCFFFVWLTLPLLLSSHISFFVSSMHPVCRPDELFALWQFKESMTVSKFDSSVPPTCSKVESWKIEENGTNCCSWDGVECDEKTGHVISLNLSGSCLYGSINSSSSLFSLVQLRNLNLAFNNFNRSQIPSSLGNLSMLKYLNLSSSSFSGQIPSEISSMSKLSSLDLQDNSLGGQIPSSLANLTSLNLLVLRRNNLHGEIPFTLAKLTELTYLDFAVNQFTGEISPFSGNLTKLSYLDLSINHFSGQLPTSLLQLSRLVHLDLAQNQFTGRIPPQLMNLTQLAYLRLRSNKLYGSIPVSVSELRNPEYLNLRSNSLSGFADMNAFLALKNLKFLSLSMNNLSLLTDASTNATPPALAVLGLDSCNLNKFPDFLRSQNQLLYLSLSFNNISGQIPKWIWNMSTETLQLMDLGCNSITGLVQPPDVLPWSNLIFFNLSSNMLQGSLPIPTSSVVFYSVSNNSFTGEIPPTICRSTTLRVLDLSNNNLSGMIPPCLGNFSDSLTILNLHGNHLVGAIPETWTRRSKLRMISLSQNRLRGTIPAALANCGVLEKLDLGNNQLNGAFPPWFGSLPELKILILRSNLFHRPIGACESASTFPKLRIIDLSSNNFIGKLPSECFQRWNAMRVVDSDSLGYLQADTSAFINGGISAFINGGTWPDHYDFSMTLVNKGLKLEYTKIIDIFSAIDLSSNRFEGEIPELIGTLQGLHMLNLSNNILSGQIPSSISNLTQLESLDLSRNQLSGQIPEQLAQLTFLGALNVSHNRLTGPIPQGNQFGTFQDSSFDGNAGLCGQPLSKKCSTYPPPSSPEEEQDSGFRLVFNWKAVPMGYVTGLVVGIIGAHYLTRRQPWFLKNLTEEGSKDGEGRKNESVMWIYCIACSTNMVNI